MLFVCAWTTLAQDVYIPFWSEPTAATYTFSVDAVSSTSVADGSSATWSHTVTASQGNRALYVAVGFWSGYSITTVTYNGTAMSHVGTYAYESDKTVAIYRLLDPAAGTHDVYVALSGNPYSLIVGAWSFTGVNQTSPNGSWCQSAGYASTAELSVSSSSGDICIGITVANEFGGTVGGGQTRDWWLQPDMDGAGIRGTASGASLTLSITCDGERTYVFGGVAVKGN